MRPRPTSRVAWILCLLMTSAVGGADLENLAPLAKPAAEPKTEEGALRALTDGDPRRGLLFAAGTKGEGTIVLRFPSPREISRIRFMQWSNVYYSTACEILGDADGSGNFTISLARTDNLAPPLQWQEFAFAPVRVAAVQWKSLAGFSGGLRARPALGELELWGKPEPGDQEEMIRMGTQPAFFSKLKPLYLETDIAAGGQARCAILVPEGAAYADLGARLAGEIERRSRPRRRGHARVTVTTDMSAAEPLRTNVIALGQMLNNRLIEKLYWNRYTFLDSAWPAGDGYCIQTVHNPYPWTSGHNVIVLGGSDQRGVRRAVEEFIERLPAGPDLRVGHLLEVRLPPPDQRPSEHLFLNSPYITFKLPAQPLAPAAAKALLEGEPAEGLLTFLKYAVLHCITGERAYAEAARRVLLLMADVYQGQPDRPPTWPEETNSRFIFALWDAVEESPVFSDADRLRITNMLLRFLYSQVPKTSGYGTLESNDTIIWNHTTFPLMGLYFGGRYFRRYYDVPYMDIYLKKAAGAFGGQERSWKPQCDADAYLTLTIGHTIEYCLAEGRMEFFDSGLCRTYADYLIAICDNRGLAAGFGDSGIFKQPSVPLAGVPYALWHYRDGRYLWYLNSITEGKWANPYHHDLKPVRPDDMTGVRVYRLDPQVYEYTRTRSYYGEPLAPPNVPYEQAFDKIVFRENFDPLGQYFILDGYARGKHLHYDGNAILKFTQDGEDWLVDGDYLVRNTTEHNMITVIRDGRCEEMIPVCSALLHHADLPTRGFSVTLAKDYNGVDWERHIAWRKGDWTLVTDRLKAVKPGRYSFDCVWKFLDRSPEEISDGRRFWVARGRASQSGHVLIEYVIEPDARVGKAALFAAPESQFQTVVRLPAGEYRVVVRARALDTGSDSLWMTLDNGEPTAHHIPVGRFGPSATTHTKDTPPPVVKITQTGDHVLTLWLRENAGIIMDTVLFEGLTPGAVGIETAAALAPPAPARPSPYPGGFSVISADPVGLSLVRRRGSSGPVKMLFQRQSATLRPGESASFRNLLYLDKEGQRKTYDALPLEAHAACLLAGGRRIISCGALDAAGLSSDAAAAEIGADTVCLVDATRFAGTQQLLSATRPVSLELDLGSGTVTFAAAAESHVKLAGGQTAAVPAGRLSLKLDALELWKKEIGKALDAVQTETRPAPPPVRQAVGRTPAPAALWTFRTKMKPEPAEFAAADIDGDGRVETLVTAGTELVCLDDQGRQRWRFPSKRSLLCVCVADVNGDKKLEVLCGGMDQSFHVLSHEGKLLASHKMTEKLVIGQGGTSLPYVRCIAAADIDGDGKAEIVAGTTNSNISAFRADDLERLWTHSGICHGAGRVALTDLDGDGKLESLVSDHYGSVHVITADGSKRTYVYSELGDVFFDTGDMDGEGKQDILNGSSTGVLTASAYPRKNLWSFINYGYAARNVLVRDLDGDGKAEAVAGFDTGFIFALGADGKPKWQLEAGSAILALAADPTNRLYAGLRDGTLLLISPKGEDLSRTSRPSPVVRILAIQKELRLLDEDGILSAERLP